MKPKCNILAYGVCLGLCFCVLLSGCATVVSKQLLTQAQRIEFDEIIKDPDVYATLHYDPKTWTSQRAGSWLFTKAFWMLLYTGGVER